MAIAAGASVVTTARSPRGVGPRRAWICCLLSFKDRRREVWGEGFTGLIVLDEVTERCGQGSGRPRTPASPCSLACAAIARPVRSRRSSFSSPRRRGKVSIKNAKIRATNIKNCLAIQVPAYVAFYRAEADFSGPLTWSSSRSPKAGGIRSCSG